MNNKKHHGLTILLIIFAVLLVLLGLSFLLYSVGSFPMFNNLIDTYVLSFVHNSSNKTDNNKNATTNFHMEKEDWLSVIENRLPVFIGLQDKAPVEYYHEIMDPYTNSVIQIAQDFYSVSAEGNFTWTYDSNWPIMTNLTFFKDSIVFINAEPSLIILDLENGKEKYTEHCPVYPSKIAFQKEHEYYFQGADQNYYMFNFENNPIATNEVNLSTKISLKEQFFPSKTVISAIRTRLVNWASYSAEQEIPTPIFLHKEFNVLISDDYTPSLYIYSPEEQGNFTVGLASESGSWITGRAYVAVFSEDGELKSVSLDYVADKPQIKIHLSNREVYYVVLGWFPETEIIPDTYLTIQKSL